MSQAPKMPKKSAQYPDALQLVGLYPRLFFNGRSSSLATRIGEEFVDGWGVETSLISPPSSFFDSVCVINEIDSDISSDFK